MTGNLGAAVAVLGHNYLAVCTAAVHHVDRIVVEGIAVVVSHIAAVVSHIAA